MNLAFSDVSGQVEGLRRGRPGASKAVQRQVPADRDPILRGEAVLALVHRRRERVTHSADWFGFSPLQFTRSNLIVLIILSRSPLPCCTNTMNYIID